MMTHCVVSFEVRTTISCKSRLVSHHFFYATSDHFINSIGISHNNTAKDVFGQLCEMEGTVVYYGFADGNATDLK